MSDIPGMPPDPFEQLGATLDAGLDESLDRAELYRMTSPIEEALARVRQLEARLSALDALPMGEESYQLATEIVRQADALWAPWMGKRIAVNGIGWVGIYVEAEPDDPSEADANGDWVNLQERYERQLVDIDGISHGFMVQTVEGKNTLLHLVEAEDRYQIGEFGVHIREDRLFVRMRLNEGVVEVNDQTAPPHTQMLEDLYPGLLADIDTAVLNEESLTEQLRALADTIDWSTVVADIPEDHLKEVLRYLWSLQLFVPNVQYLVDNAELAEWALHIPGMDDDLPDAERVQLAERGRRIAVIGGFVLGPAAMGGDISRLSQSAYELGLNADCITRQGKRYLGVLRITGQVAFGPSMADLWDKNSV